MMTGEVFMKNLKIIKKNLVWEKQKAHIIKFKKYNLKFKRIVTFSNKENKFGKKGLEETYFLII